MANLISWCVPRRETKKRNVRERQVPSLSLLLPMISEFSQTENCGFFIFLKELVRATSNFWLSRPELFYRSQKLSTRISETSETNLSLYLKSVHMIQLKWATDLLILSRKPIRYHSIVNYSICNSSNYPARCPSPFLPFRTWTFIRGLSRHTHFRPVSKQTQYVFRTYQSLSSSPKTAVRFHFHSTSARNSASSLCV